MSALYALHKIQCTLRKRITKYAMKIDVHSTTIMLKSKLSSDYATNRW